MSDITLFNKDGKILASSREVAEKFGKEHDKVCRDIKRLLKSQPTKLAVEFIESEYSSDRGRMYTEFLMTRNGFSLLCMGFTGSKALDWKIKYIDAFNRMEQELKNPYKLPTTYKEALIQLLEKVEENEKLTIENAEMKPKAEYHDEVLNKDGLITTTVIAKDLGFKSATKLNQILNLNHILFKNQSGTWCPYAEYEWLITENYADYQSYGAEKSKPCLKWTERGRKWITQNYNKWVKNLIK